MYQLIADSGSTKTDWVLLAGSQLVARVKTIGFSPYYQTADQISHELVSELKPRISEYLEGIGQVHYYGTGCSTPENCKLIEDCINQSLHVKNIRVNHDLLAAARALCKNEWGIASILGTGSNSCLYNGTDIIENVPSAGYLWGDYGGGSQIGKFFIREYFEGGLPTDLKFAFEQAGYTKEAILNNVYKKSAPSKYLASVSGFASKHISHPVVIKVLTECFDSFFVQQVNKYTDSKKYKVHTVGSVGYYYKNFIASVAQKHGYQMGTVIQSPIEGLVEYHSM